MSGLISDGSNGGNMEKKWLKGIAWGMCAAAVLTIGLVATMPHIDAAQDQTQAQGERVGPDGRGPKGAFGRGGRMGGPMDGGFGFREIMRDLTDAQRQQVRAIQERHAQQIRPLAERAHNAREAVHAAVLSGNTANLQALSIEVGSAETELTFAQAQVQAEIFQVLTPEQKQKIAEARKQMEARRSEMMQRRQQRAQ
jgi:Spy/CpxP family protein refolding chaperone